MTTLYVKSKSDLLDVFEEASEDFMDVAIFESVYRGNAEVFASFVVEGLLHVAKKAGFEACLNRPKEVVVRRGPPPVPPRAKKG